MFITRLSLIANVVLHQGGERKALHMLVNLTRVVPVGFVCAPSQHSSDRRTADLL